MMLRSTVKHVPCTMSKWSIIGPPVGIKPTLLQCRCNALASEL